MPAVALLLAVEVLSRVGKPVADVAEVTPAADVAAEQVAEQVAEVTPVPVAQVVDVDVSPAAEVTSPRRRPRRDTRPARQSHADAIRDAAAKPGATPARVAAALGVSVRTCQRHWPRPTVATPALVAVAA
ncbi:hypothetical protein NCC78_30330 [Micromonospora phytophila]|uniref:hypothetical protein n=1 Tax=Micromonospora phytophila TaxID=709888 RepID=UPI00202E44B1|nr:hypothetical protein [Micromonospora phytophila]MCM0678933.1 hypothetical protein [Micromonospora phytophila]